MTYKISRRSFVGQLGAMGAAAGGAVMLPEANADVVNPDPDHMKQTKKGWIIKPTGVDDLANIEHALRNTAPGGKVKLQRGTFKFSGAASVANFDGRLVGAGRDETILTCTDQYNYEMWEAAGSPEPSRPPPFPRLPIEGSTTRGAPGLIIFYKTPVQPGEDPEDRATSIELRDFSCRGNMIGELWALGDEVICISISNSIDWNNPDVRQPTSRQDVVISRVDAAGYATPEFGPFGNACACINVLGGLVLTDNYNLEGSVDGDALGIANGGILAITPAEGNVTMSDCRLANCRLGPAIVGYRNGNLLYENISTDGCRADCVRFFDNGNCVQKVRDCDLFCNSFTLPAEIAPNGIDNQPSSLGCVLAIQGLEAVFGFPQNLQWLTLAFDEDAHDAHPEAGPLGTWRPQGPVAIPTPSTLEVTDNTCLSSETPFTYCTHVIDGVNLATEGQMPTISVDIRRNTCQDSQTCISLEHVNDALVSNNVCASQAVGVELHNSPNAQIVGNSFDFTQAGPGCEILSLGLGSKPSFSHVLPGAGECTAQDAD